MDKVFTQIAAIRAAVSRYVQAVREFIASTRGKVILAAVLLVAVAAYAHHRGSAGKSELKAQVAALQKRLADVEAKPRPQPVIIPADPGLAGRLAASEEAKEKLQRKVSDYEKRLQKRGKRNNFKLSPADARELSNL